MRPIDRECVKILTSGAIRSSRRSRQFFAATLILSALNVVASYNLYWSWLRRFAMMASASSNAIVKSNQMELMKEWIGSTFVSIPVLGIKMHVSDASMLGSIAVCLFMLATMFSMRKHNHSVGQLVRRVALTRDLDLMRYAYYGLSTEMVFNPTTGNDRPIEDLGDPNQNESGGKLVGIRNVFSALFFVPAVAIAIVFLCDIISIFWWHSPFREHHTTVGTILIMKPTVLITAAIMLMVALCCLIVTAMLGWKARDYQRANNKLMSLMAREIDNLDKNTSSLEETAEGLNSKA